MGQQLERLNARHHAVMRLVLLGSCSQNEIARLTGFDAGSISMIVNSPLFQDELARRRSSLEKSEESEALSQMRLAQSFLENASVGAAVKLDELAHSCPDPNVQLRASTEILKMAFRKEDQKGPQIQQVIVLDPSKLDFLNKVAQEAGFTETKYVNSRESEETPERDSDGSNRRADSEASGDGRAESLLLR